MAGTYKDGLATVLASYSGIHTAYSLDGDNVNDGTASETAGSGGTYDSATGYPNQGQTNQTAPGTSGPLDNFPILDAALLLYVPPSGISTGVSYGLFHDGGGTNGQGAWLRDTGTAIEIGCSHNNGGSDQDSAVYELPSTGRWYCVGFQFHDNAGNIAVWVDGVNVTENARSFAIANGSGNPLIGDANHDTITGWSSTKTPIDSTGIIIANLILDNAADSASDVTTADTTSALGDSFYTDYFAAHDDSGPSITDVETDEDFRDGDTAVTITGATFEASQGTGKVELSDNATYASGTKIAQTVTSWADTSIDFTAVLSTLAPGPLYLWVTNDSGDRNSVGFAVNVHRKVAITLSASANVPAGGEATTALLTAPSGKTTGDFSTGRRWDDENGTDALDHATDTYTEYEWWIEATADAAGQYEFRVLIDSAALDAYTVTPKWTISSGTIIAPVGQSSTGSTSTAPLDASTAITPTGESSTGVEGTANVVGEAAITPTGQISTGTEGAASIDPTATIGPVGQSSTGSEGTAPLDAAVAITPTGQSSAGSEGTAPLDAATSITPTGQSSAAVEGVADVVGEASIAPTGQSSVGVEGSADIDAAVTITPVGQTSTGSEGTAPLDASTSVTPVGQTSVGTEGTADVVSEVVIDPVGQSSTGIEGSAPLIAAVTITPVGQSSTGVEGIADVNPTAVIDPTGESSTGVEGTADIATDTTIDPVGQSSIGVEGTAPIDSTAIIDPVGQSSTGIQGAADVTSGVTVTPVGQFSAGSEGTASLDASAVVDPTGQLSIGVEGTAGIDPTAVIDPVGQSSTGAEGGADVVGTATITTIGQSSSGVTGVADIVPDTSVIIGPVGQSSEGMEGSAPLVATVTIIPVGQSSTAVPGVAPLVSGNMAVDTIIIPVYREKSYATVFRERSFACAYRQTSFARTYRQGG